MLGHMVFQTLIALAIFAALAFYAQAVLGAPPSDLRHIARQFAAHGDRVLKTIKLGNVRPIGGNLPVRLYRVEVQQLSGAKAVSIVAAEGWPPFDPKLWRIDDEGRRRAFY